MDLDEFERSAFWCFGIFEERARIGLDEQLGRGLIEISSFYQSHFSYHFGYFFW